MAHFSFYSIINVIDIAIGSQAGKIRADTPKSISHALNTFTQEFAYKQHCAFIRAINAIICFQFLLQHHLKIK